MSGPTPDRRTVLGTLAAAGAASLAGCPATSPATSPAADGTTTPLDTADSRRLAEQFAPTVYFDEREPWFPTDPRPYTSQRDGETVVTGFDALDGYHERFTGSQPPDPTVFYNVVGYEQSPLAAVQFWFYSVFDQFTTNFHWHDWEVLHVFVDTTDGTPQLYVASSHSRKVPNNEFLDPDPETVPRILAELGSHSSALSLNDRADQFQRLPGDGTLADITNSAVESLEDAAGVPLAYGLPRDEGSRLPYLLPEYEGEPVYRHPELPAVEREDLVPDELVVRSLESFAGAATDLPARETGLRFDHAGRDDGGADVAYDLVPTSEIEHITDFTGPQLSFEFSVPEAVEDAVSGHISTTGAPWGQSRYANPAADITEPNHRDALAERYSAIGSAAPVNSVVATVSQAVPNSDAPDGDGVTTQPSALESVALVESDPEAVPSFGGVVAVQGVESGDHRLTVNRAGAAPHSEGVTVTDDDRPTVAGVGGEIPLVARERARKIELDPADADSSLRALAIEDDFAGRLYDAPLDGPDAVYVHENGAYTTEVRDAAGAVGAFRVNPDRGAAGPLAIAEPNTGKASLGTFVADVAAETRDQVAATDDGDRTGRENAVRGLTRALDAVVSAARRAARAARSGNRSSADRRLETVARRLETVLERLDAASDDLDTSLSTAARYRVDRATRRAEQARQQSKL